MEDSMLHSSINLTTCHLKQFPQFCDMQIEEQCQRKYVGSRNKGEAMGNNYPSVTLTR